MTPVPTQTIAVRDAIGQLCHGGDQSIEDGDLDSLLQVVQTLASYVPEPVHCDLLEVATACKYEPARAIVAWEHLKDRLYRDLLS